MKYAGEQAVVCGEVRYATENMAIVNCDTILLGDNKEKVNFSVKIIFNEDITLIPSSKITVRIDFNDEVLSHFKSEYSLYGFASNITVNKLSDNRSLNYIIYKSREFICESMPFKSSDTSHFIQGIILGKKDDISGVFLNMFNTIGLSHFMALSGLHLILAAAFSDFILMFFLSSYRVRSVVSLIVVLAFTFVSGFSVSCVRAAIMMAIYYLGRLFGKIPDSLTSLSISCYAILLVTPYNLGSISFLLSSFATLGIIVLFPFFRNLLDFGLENNLVGRTIKALRDIFLLSLCANIMCLPIIAFFFKSVCVISPFISLVISLPMQLLFYVGALGTVLFFVPIVSTVFSVVANWLYSIVKHIVESFYYIKNITLTDGYAFFYFVVILLVALVVGVFILYKALNKSKKSSRLAFVYFGGYAVLCSILFIINSFVSRDKIYVHFADVGNGSASIISFDETATIVDCGGDYSNEIFSTLTRDSIKCVDSVYLTHLDDDHISFIDELTEKYTVKRIYVPYFSDIAIVKEKLLHSNDNLPEIVVIENDTNMKLYNDSEITCYVENNHKVQYIDNLSAVYKFSVGDTSILFTGDIGIYQEYYFLEHGKEFDVDILSVPHHGSSTSSHQDFIDLCSPDYSVISVAKNNQYGLPDDNVVEAYKKISEVLSTARYSTITFQFDSEGYKYLNEY